MVRIVALALALVACSDTEKKSEPPAPASADKATAAPAAQVPAAAEVHDASCEALRDKYLAWTANRVNQAIGPLEGAQKAELQAEADKETARAKDKFVGACIAMGTALDPSCFEIDHSMSRDREKHKRCMKIVDELEANMFAH